MKKKLKIILFMLAGAFSSINAQIPFTTIVKEKAKYYIEVDPNKDFGRNFLKGKQLFIDNTGAAKKEISLDSIGPIFFGSNSISGDFIGAEQTVMRLSTNIVYYKLYFYTDAKADKSYHLPLFLISRLSSKYDSSNVSTATDALDYDGSPVSIRLMPSWSKKVGDENQLYYGFIIDYRGLNLTDEFGKSKYRQGFYSAVGLTYGGRGSGQRVGTGEVTPGIWTFSLMLQCFLTDSDVIKEMYKSDEKYILSAQALFNFFAGKDNPLNIRAGAQYYFSDPLNAQKFSIKLGLGMSN
jgi:hypothetical protein